MVNVTVHKAFRDLNEHVDRRPNDTFVATEERAREIEAKLPGYITHESAPQDDGADLSALKVSELRKLAAERGVTIPRNASKDRILTLLEG